ncbi:MAG: hypothetical protein HYY44_05895, partial [Deltaproteobacteria bacterium]|nr:hypothetical protein [Deltaproteobacteria bacterium]
KVGPINEPILNGGLGNGGANEYFCSGEDEAYVYRRHNGGSLESSSTNPGTYNTILQEDICRTEGGCGNIEPDNKCFLFSLPTHAINCHPLGRKKVWDAITYENSQDNSSSSPRNAGHSGWQGRNYIDDRYGFLFGRYLIDQVQCPSVEAASSPVAPLMEVTLSRYANQRYDPFKQNRPVLDVPYSLNHLKWGFTCGVLSARKAYSKANPLFDTFWGGYSGNGRTMGAEHKNHYKTLLAMATNRLCKNVGEGTFGNFNYPGLESDTPLKEMREIVVPVCNTLKTMIDRIPGDCGGQGCSTFRYLANYFQGKALEMREGGTAGGTFIEYRPDAHAIFLEHQVYDDCEGKRASNSGPLYNISGNVGGRCRPSYGQWHGTGSSRGLFENEFESTTGFDLSYVGSGSDRRVQANTWGLVPAEGYSPIVIARLAHELIHAWNFQEKGKTLEGWPVSPEAIYEEERAVLGQALIYYYLCDLGFCPKRYEMEKKEFVRSYSNNNAVRGVRYLYAHECRGYQGIYLGPFCNNMFTIAHYLIGDPGWENHHAPELARILALWHAKAPTLHTPQFRTVGSTLLRNGVRTVEAVEEPFAYLPMHGPTSGSSNTLQQNQQTIQQQTGGAQMQNGTSTPSGGLPPGSMSDSPFPPSGQGNNR